MKRYYFFLMLCLMMSVMTSCKDVLGMDVEGSDHPNDTITMLQNDTISVHDTTTIITPANPVVITIWSDKNDEVIKGDTVIIYRDSTQNKPGDATESYELGSNKVDNGTNYVDIQPTSYLIDGQVVLNTDVNRSAAISNDEDTLFVRKVASVQSTIGRPSTNSAYDVRGDYDINTGYRNYTITLNDGSEYAVATEAESASAMYRGEKKNLLYRMVSGVKVLSVKDELTTDTVVKGKKIYRKANRVMAVQVESLNRPLMGPEVVTLDTLVIESSKASYTDGVAEVFVEDGEIEDEPDPDPDPDPTPDPKPEDEGYTIDNEKIEAIIFSYTISPNKTLKEVLLVRTASYVMPVVSRTLMDPVKVNNPKDYNTVAWAGKWVPAYLSIEEGFVWRVDGSVVANATDASIDWLASSTGITSISRGDFLKDAKFVNEGKTTRVYLGNTLYMVLSN
jgi:hypothetical protein